MKLTLKEILEGMQSAYLHRYIADKKGFKLDAATHRGSYLVWKSLFIQAGGNEVEVSNMQIEVIKQAKRLLK